MFRPAFSSVLLIYTKTGWYEGDLDIFLLVIVQITVATLQLFSVYIFQFVTHCVLPLYLDVLDCWSLIGSNNTIYSTCSVPFS